MSANDSHGTNVYIVDDEPSIVTAYTRLLRAARMRPHTYGSVEELLRAELAASDACVVADVHLPGLSGLEIPLLLQNAGHRLPVIFVTGQETPEARALALSRGAAGWFRKPIDDAALIDAIRWAISNTRD